MTMIHTVAETSMFAWAHQMSSDMVALILISHSTEGTFARTLLVVVPDWE